MEVSITGILLVIILNLVPAKVRSFTMTNSGGDEIIYTQQDDKGWLAKDGDKTLATYYLEGTKVTTKRDGESITADLGEMLGIDEETDWTKLEKVMVGKTPLIIERKENGLKLTPKDKPDSGDKHAVVVDWELPEE